MRIIPVLLAVLLLVPAMLPGQLTLRPGIEIPQLAGFKPLPAEDPAFDEAIGKLVVETKLDEMTPAADNPDQEDEWASVCVVDLSDPAAPRVGGWRAGNFIYPASVYKMYVVGEAVRQVCAGEHTMDDPIVVKEHNVRDDDHLTSGQQVSLGEVLRLVCAHSDNTAANEAIDFVDRQRATALMRALGCTGSDITRKYLSRKLEDPGYADVPSTSSCGRDAATFLWAVETGAIGGGRGRGLVRAFLAMNATKPERMRAGLPASATLMSKSGWWNVFNGECGIVEDGRTRYILCVFTALPEEKANPRIAEFTRKVHALLNSN